MLHQSPTLSSARAAGHLNSLKLVRCMMIVTTTVTIIMQASYRRHVLDRVAVEKSGKRDAGHQHTGRGEDRIARRADIERPDIGKEQEGD